MQVFFCAVWTYIRWHMRWLPMLESVGTVIAFWKFLTGFAKPEENSRSPSGIHRPLHRGREPEAFLFKVGCSNGRKSKACTMLFPQLLPECVASQNASRSPRMFYSELLCESVSFWLSVSLHVAWFFYPPPIDIVTTLPGISILALLSV